MGQSIQMWGSPPIYNFTPRHYRASGPNWAVAVAPTGLVYVANQQGLLEYDGEHWRLVPTPGAARTVAVAASGQVFVGGTGFLGCLQPDSLTGAPRFASLAGLLPKDAEPPGEVWSVRGLGSRVLFQTDDRVLLYDGKTLETLPAANFFTLGHAVGNDYFVQENERGLWKLADRKLAPVPGSERFGSSLVAQMLPWGDQKTLLAVQSEGLWVLEQGNLRPWPTQADEMMQQFRVQTACWLPGNGPGPRRLAVGLLGLGLVVLDDRGRLLQIVNRRNGLAGDFVTGLAPDAQGGLWVATDRGLSYLQTGAPFATLTEAYHGLRGPVNAVARLRDDLFVATSAGLWRALPRTLTPEGASRPFYDAALAKVPDLPMEVWTILPVGDDLLLGTFEGVKVWRNGVLAQLSTDEVPPDVRVLERSALDPNRVFAGSAYNLRAVRLSDGQWSDEGEIEGLADDLRAIKEDKAGNLWVATVAGTLYKLDFSAGATYRFRLQPTVTPVELPAPPPVAGPLGLFLLGGEIRVSSGQQVYRYEAAKNRLQPDEKFANVYRAGASALHLLDKDASGQVWGYLANPDGSLRPATVATTGQTNYQVARPPLPPYLVQPCPPFHEYRFTWLGDAEGLYLYNRLEVEDRPPPAAPQLRRLLAFGADSIDLQQFTSGETLEVGPGTDWLELQFATSASLGQAQYQWRLRPLMEQWRPARREPAARLGQLPPGAYTLEVRALLPDGRLSPILAQPLRVLGPWYTRGWAYLLYALALAGLAYFGLRRFWQRTASQG
ncbi:MAG: hypothetical protein MUC97_05260 [Bernardetiaceae bacterium]|nr:hypothetical protein [Bernardetiaceae bacterium]